MDNVALAHVPHVEVVECFDDLVFGAVDWMGLEVKESQDIAERDRPEQLFSVEIDDVFRIGHPIFDAEIGQEILVFL